MGHHFVPRYYLRAFQDQVTPGHTWITSRRSAQPVLAPIANVAQARGYYDPAVEIDLHDLVESPANPVLDKLRAGEAITLEERITFAVYIATMMTRGPGRRSQADELYPKVLKDTVEGLRAQLIQRSADPSANQQVISAHLEQLDAIHEKYLREPPESVTQQVRMPWPTYDMVQAVATMRWCLFSTGEPHCFITSDNPVFYFRCYGLSKPESEISFPLSPTRLLHGLRGKISPVLHTAEARAPLVKEFNRRMASAASSIVLAHKTLPWSVTLLTKSKHHLNRVNWT